MKFLLSLTWPEVTFYVREDWQGGEKKGPFKAFKGASRQQALERARIGIHGFLCEKLDEKVVNGETIVLKLNRKTTILG